jgi:hypothetical protein
VSGKEIYKQIALQSYEFLYNNLLQSGVPVVVGNKGWWQKGGKMPLYGQQPIDVAYMCLTSFAFFDILREEKFSEDAKLYYSWFHGNNLKKQNMIREDGACYDGLYEDGVNPNAGAESNICYLLASLQMKEKGILERQ